MRYLKAERDAAALAASVSSSALRLPPESRAGREETCTALVS